MTLSADQIKAAAINTAVRNKLRRLKDQTISCGCGCGAKMNATDKWGRPRAYLPGHATREHVVKMATQENAPTMRDRRTNFAHARFFAALVWSEAHGVLESALVNLLGEQGHAVHAALKDKLISNGWFTPPQDPQ